MTVYQALCVHFVREYHSSSYSLNNPYTLTRGFNQARTQSLYLLFTYGIHLKIFEVVPSGFFLISVLFSNTFNHFICVTVP